MMSFCIISLISTRFSSSAIVAHSILRIRCFSNFVTNNRITWIRALSHPLWRCFYTSTSLARQTALKQKPRDDQIKFKEIFLVNEKGEKIGNIGIVKALKLAKEKNLHVVQLREATNKEHEIPLCKLMSHETIFAVRNIQTKQESEVKRKEMKFSSEITDYDLTHKLKIMARLLDGGCHVSVVVMSNNTRKAKQQDRIDKLKKITELISEHGILDGKIKPSKNMVTANIKPVEK